MTMHSDPGKGRRLPLDWLATPALAYSHPSEVLASPDLTDPERKAILASWASDARAVEDMPWLRKLENGSIVSLAEVLEALRTLDRAGDSGPKHAQPPRASRLARILRRRPVTPIGVEGAP